MFLTFLKMELPILIVLHKCYVSLMNYQFIFLFSDKYEMLQSKMYSLHKATAINRNNLEN